MARHVTFNVRERKTEEVLVVEVIGSIESWEDLGDVAKIIESSEYPIILINMKGVGFINCAGVGKIMAMSYIAKELGKRLCFVGMQPFVHKVFDLLDGDHFVRVFESEAEVFSDGSFGTLKLRSQGYVSGLLPAGR